MNRKQLLRAREDIRNYLELVYELRARSEGAAPGGGGGAELIPGHVSLDSEEWRTAETTWDPCDPFASEVRYVAVSRSILTPAERREYMRHDDCPAEYESNEDLLAAYIDDANALLDPSSFETIIGGAANHIEMANQLHWFAYNVPTVHEIAKIFYRSFHAVRSLPPSWKPTDQHVLRLEAITLAVVMISTGAALHKACELRLHPFEPEIFDGDLGLVMARGRTRCWWWVRAPLPDYQTDDSDKDLTQVVKFPDLAHAGCMARLVLRLRGFKDAVNGPVRLFPRPSRIYARVLRRVLRDIDPSQRTTAAKLPNFLFAHLVRAAGGDVADACFASAHWHDLARVPSFYSTPSVSRLQQLYTTTAGHLGTAIRSAVRQLISEQTGTSFSSPPTRPFTLPPTMRRVGNRRCPTREVARNAIRVIKTDLQALVRSKNRLDMLRLHVLYELYTLEFFAACVGVRSVCTPYLALDRIDEVTGFAVLTEKTTRPVWLPPKMVRHMKFHHDYLNTQTLITPLPHFGAAVPAPCFLIDENGCPVEITPSIKTECLKDYFDFPANIFRRFIRNELRENGCPASVAKAWMSHSSRGEEIHHSYSQFSLGAYRQALRHYLVPILDDLGFEPLQIR